MVWFFGTPTRSVGYDALFANVQQIKNIFARQCLFVNQIQDKTRGMNQGLMVVLLSHKAELSSLMSVIPLFKKDIDQGSLRIVVYSLLKADSSFNLDSVLSKLGISEVIQEGLPQKTLILKVQQHLQQIASPPPAQISIPPTKGGRSKTQVQMSSALELEQDFWLATDASDFKCVRGVWLCEMLGPGPSVGSWVEVPSQSQKGRSVFEWVSKFPAGQDPFLPGRGTWFFVGRKPEFIWKNECWRFVSPSPALFYKAPGESASFRFRSRQDDILDLAENSKSAERKLQAIRSSFAKDPVHPAQPHEWLTGEKTFDQTRLAISVTRVESPNGASLVDAVMLERENGLIWLEIPSAGIQPDELLSFRLSLIEKDSLRVLELKGRVRQIHSSLASTDSGRELVLVEMEKDSYPQLDEIDATIEQKQLEITRFLMEATGHG